MVVTLEMGERVECFGYVQLRGSVPVYWGQNVDLGVKPRIEQRLGFGENK